jgi:hypothetical protein
VNERLREARRKTGVGSSRELARLLKSQENRHNEMGMAKHRPSAALLPLSAAEPWRPQPGVWMMVALLLGAIGAAALVAGQASNTGNQTAGVVDPLIGEPMPKFSDPADLHTQIRAEKRDQEWATRTEAAVRSRVLQIPVIGKDGNVLRVTCAATLCEIAGTLIGPGQPPREYDPNLPVNRAVADLQDKPLKNDLAKLGLKHESGSFTSGKGKPDRSVFLIYYTRGK